MNNRINALLKMTERWVVSSIITSDQAEVIKNELESQSTVINTKNAKKLILTLTNLLLTIGIILILSGLIYFVASNWQQMSKVYKLSLLCGMVFLFYATGLMLDGIQKRQTFIVTLCYIAGVISFGIALSLIGQIYNMNANSARFFLIWSIPALLFAIFTGFEVFITISVILINISLFFHFFPDARFWNNLYSSVIVKNFLIIIFFNVIIPVTKELVVNLPVRIFILVKDRFHTVYQRSFHSKYADFAYTFSYFLVCIYMYLLSFKFSSESLFIPINIFFIAFIIGSFYYYALYKNNQVIVYYTLVISIIYAITKYIEIIIIFIDEYHLEIEQILVLLLCSGLCIFPLMMFLTGKFVRFLKRRNYEK